MPYIPRVNRHVSYLQQKTVNGNATYVKRRPATITATPGPGFIVDLRVGHHSETYAGVDKRAHPDDNDVAEYVPY
jgi:hypothetical protein